MTHEELQQEVQNAGKKYPERQPQFEELYAMAEQEPAEAQKYGTRLKEIVREAEGG